MERVGSFLIACVLIFAVMLALPGSVEISMAGAAVGSNRVHFSTCTQSGVEAGCVVAKADDGRTYNVTSVRPVMKAGQWLQGTGTVKNRMSLCMQGSAISNFVLDREQKPIACGR